MAAPTTRKILARELKFREYKASDEKADPIE
jgi:hypothetical protein